MIIGNDKMESVSLRPYAEIMNAGEEHYSADSIFNPYRNFPFIPMDSVQQTMGFNNKSFWMRFGIENNTTTPLSYYLETGRHITDKVTLYLRDESGNITVYESGDAIPFSKKSITYRKSVFPLNIKPKSKLEAVLFLKSDGKVLNLPLNLITENDFLYATARNQLFYGFFYGILLLAFFIYLFFYSAMHDITFLYYGLYLLFIGLLEFSLDGSFRQYILPGASYFSKGVVLATGIITLFIFGKYVQKFLNIGACKQILLSNYEFAALILPTCLLGLFCYINLSANFYPIVNIIGLLLIIKSIAIIAYLKIKNKEADVYFVTGITCASLGFTVFILNNLNILSASFFTENGFKFGIGLEVIFLSLSMGNRISKLT